MPLIDPTAKQSIFEKFYHYQPFNKDHLIVMLKEQKLFFSDPHNVNDPWDCKPWFDYRTLLEDPAKREEMITFLRLAAPHLEDHPLRPYYEDRIRTNDAELRNAVEMSSSLLIKQIAERRIYCLTPFPDSTLMWSHYAANHRGLCLEFDKNNPLIEKARPVRYRKTYPVWTPLSALNDPLEVVFTKSMDWSYEREFRILASSLDGPLKLYDNFVLLPAGALTSIIVGCESKDYAEVLTIVSEHMPLVSMKRIVRSPNEYKLQIEE